MEMDPDGVVCEFDVPFVRSPYNYNRDAVSLETALFTPEPSLAVQEALEETDINTIVRRFGLTGKFPEGLVMPVYGDFCGIDNYHAAANAIAEANETFDQLPADIRSRFANEPGAFVDFALNPDNRAEMEKWGMVAPAAAPGGAVSAAVPEAPVDK